MTHFATTLGIKEILYSGFHQKDYRYFWQLEHEALSKVDKLVKHYLEHREAAGILTSKDDERVSITYLTIWLTLIALRNMGSITTQY